MRRNLTTLLLLFVLLSMTAQNITFEGHVIDDEKNENGKDAFVMTADNSKVLGFVIPTNEELMIARDTKALCE